MDNYDFLDSERKKLWVKVSQIDEDLKRLTPEAIQILLNQAADVDRVKNEIEIDRQRISSHLAEVEAARKKVTEESEKAAAIFIAINTSANTAKINTDAITANASDAQIKLAEIGSRKTIVDSSVIEFATRSAKLPEIDLSLKTIIEVFNKIELLGKNIAEKHSEMTSLYTEIFGYDEIDPSTKVPKKIEGTKDKLNSTYLELTKKIDKSEIAVMEIVANSKTRSKELHDQWDSTHSALKSKIEGLLPKALTAGLSYAYHEKKNDEIIEMRKSNRVFFIAIILLIIISLIPFGISIWSLVHNMSLDVVVMRMPRLVIAIIPLYIPVLWMAYSSGKKVNLSKRLIEEYAHKEAIGKTFEGLSKQIEGIQDEKTSRELRTHLLYNILEVSAENPGKLITEYNKSDHPLMDALDKSVKLTNAVHKLAKIPGFSRLAKKLDEKASAMLKDEEIKATQGIATLDEENKK